MSLSLFTSVLRLGLILSLPLIPGAIASAQDKKPEWQRVITATGFTVDVDASSLKFEPDQIVSAKFRTVLAKSEPLAANSTVKYKTRVEALQFKIFEGKYRSTEISLLDSSGKVAQTNAGSPPKDWKPLTGSGGSWFGGLRTLRPFGGWTVVSYKLVDQKAGEKFDSLELNKLLGSYVVVEFDSVRVGKTTCSRPLYESRKLADTDLDKLFGTSVKALGLEASDANVIALRCAQYDWQHGQSLLVPITQDRMLMLWDGVFLELVDKKPKSFTIPFVIR